MCKPFLSLKYFIYMWLLNVKTPFILNFSVSQPQVDEYDAGDAELRKSLGLTLSRGESQSQRWQDSLESPRGFLKWSVLDTSEIHTKYLFFYDLKLHDLFSMPKFHTASVRSQKRNSPIFLSETSAPA
jgi:hypothetical protein